MATKSSGPPRVMDVTHPKNVRPSSNSRPVLVTNRPMIAEDPMIAQVAREAAEKGSELPAGAPSAPLVPSEEATVSRQAKLVKPISVSHADDVEVKPEEPIADTDTVAEVEDIETTYASDAKEPEAPSDSTAAPAEAVNDAATEQTYPAQRPAAAMHAANMPGEGAAMSIDGDDGDEDSEPRPETPEEKLSHDFEAHVAKGTYFVPINQAGKRRGRIVMSIVVIVLLGLIMVNLLLDMGIIDIPGLPHTTFFSF